jgi:hypothetical protein
MKLIANRRQEPYFQEGKQEIERENATEGQWTFMSLRQGAAMFSAS